jgi:uncharacterized protein (DUF2267 family)
MKHDEFIGQVQNRARLASRGDAEVATRAVLETLAERLSGNEPANAAAQLPKGLANYLKHEYAGSGIRYSLDEFLQVVSRREGVELPKATFHTRAVMEVLGEAISSGEMDDIRTQLPPDYLPLFEGSQGRM